MGRPNAFHGHFQFHIGKNTKPTALSCSKIRTSVRIQQGYCRRRADYYLKRVWGNQTSTNQFATYWASAVTAFPFGEEFKSANAFEGVEQVLSQAEKDPKFARSKKSCGLNDILDHRDGDGQGIIWTRSEGIRISRINSRRTCSARLVRFRGCTLLSFDLWRNYFINYTSVDPKFVLTFNRGGRGRG